MSSPRCILVIDDEADIREIAKLSLEMTRDWKVLLAASGKEGIAIATQHQPDAILLDVIMPELGGLETFQQIRQTPETQHIPIILLTATVASTARKTYAQFGVDAMLSKPFDPGKLAAQIEVTLGWT